MLGRSAQMQHVRETVLTLAGTSADVVIYGETGTGKDLVARCLHDHSDRRRANYRAAELRRDVRGAGRERTVRPRSGLIHRRDARRALASSSMRKAARSFLDEIESMPMAVQIKFLRALQERSIERIGSNKPIPVDCRVIAAAKDDLKALSDQQKFRSDLYYRIGVAFIELPPLRERREDIPLLFEHFTLLAASRYGRTAPMVGSSQLSRTDGLCVARQCARTTKRSRPVRTGLARGSSDLDNRRSRNALRLAATGRAFRARHDHRGVETQSW